MKTRFFACVTMAIFCTLTLSHCGGGGGGGSSDDSVVYTKGYPYGADGFSDTIDADGDGTPEQTVVVQFTYDSDKNVSLYTTVTNDYDSEGNLISRTEESCLINPTLTVAENDYTMGTRGCSEIKSYLPGAIIEGISKTYSVEGDILSTTPSEIHTDQYTYDADGYPLTYDYTDQDEEEGTTRNATLVYDDAKRVTNFSWVTYEDSDVDGVTDGIYSKTTTWEFDSYGNLISYTMLQTDDSDADGISDDTTDVTLEYQHTYEDGVLVSTLLVNDAYGRTYSYTYDDSGRISHYQVGEDRYPTDGVNDNFYIWDYTYNDAGQVLTQDYNFYRFGNYTTDISYQAITNQDYIFDASGRLLNRAVQRKKDNDFATTGYSQSSGNDYTYSYSDAGQLLTYGSYKLGDVDLDGELDAKTFSWDIGYDYNDAGSLTDYNAHTINYSDDGTTVTSESNKSYTFAYEGSQLNSIVKTKSVYSDLETTNHSLSYSSNGRVSSYLKTVDNETDGTIDETTEVSFTYGADTITATAVTGASVKTRTIDFSDYKFKAENVDYYYNSQTVKNLVEPTFNNTICLYYTNDSTFYDYNEKEYVMSASAPNILDFLTKLDFIEVN